MSRKMNEIPTTCQFRTYGYKCGKPVEHGNLFCERHKKARCASCGLPATHERCDYCGQFVCWWGPAPALSTPSEAKQ